MYNEQVLLSWNHLVRRRKICFTIRLTFPNQTGTKFRLSSRNHLSFNILGCHPYQLILKKIGCLRSSEHTSIRAVYHFDLVSAQIVIHRINCLDA